MDRTLDIISRILGGGKKPEAGSVAAQRAALLFYHYKARSRSLLTLLGCAALTLVLWSHFGKPHYFAIYFCMLTGSLGGFGSHEETWHNEAFIRLLPVDAKTAFRLRFFPGLIFITLLPAAVMIIALLLLHADFGYHLAVVSVGAPACVFAAGFIVHRISASTLLLTALGIIVLTVVAFLAAAVFGSHFDAFCMAVHPLVYVVAVVAAYRFALKENLRRQFLIESEPASYIRKKPTMPALLGPANAVAKPRPPVAKIPVAPSPEKPARNLSDATRRRALFDFVYGKRMPTAKWIITLWALLVIPFPPFFQMMMHLLFSALFWEFVAVRYWRFNPLEEYASLLPASRTEIFLLRYGPLLAAQVALGLTGLFCFCVLKIPNAWLGGHFGFGGDAMIPAAFFAGPLLTGFLVLNGVWRKIGTWLGVVFWLIFVSGGKIGLGPEKLTGIIDAHPALFGLLLTVVTTGLIGLGHSGFLKKEIPARSTL